MNPVAYWVDKRDRLVYVNGAWDEFAAANDAPDMLSPKVLRRPLWDFVVDGGTRQVYAQLLEIVRTGRVVQVAIRCDGPDLRRFLELELSHRGDGIVSFVSRMVRAEERPAVTLLRRDAAQPRDAFIRACGWCKRFETEPGEWVEVEEAVATLHLLERMRLPAISHGMCRQCAADWEFQIEVLAAGA